MWEEGHEPGREVVALGIALTLTAACFDLVVTTHLGVLFDLGFVVVCVALALAVHPRDFFVVGVLPPLLLLATFFLLAASRSEALHHAGDALLPTVVSALSAHALALVLGYLACLGVLTMRRRVLERLATACEREPVTRSGRGLRLPA